MERDENGEQRITTDTESGALTTERIREIQEMAPETARRQLRSARDKLIWFRHQVDKNTEDFTQGCNEIRVAREDLIQDSLKHFLALKDLRKVIASWI